MKHKHNFTIQFFITKHFFQKMFLFYFFLFSILGNFSLFFNKIYAEEVIEVVEKSENLKSLNSEIVELKKVEENSNLENSKEKIKFEKEIKKETKNNLLKQNLEISKVEEIEKEENSLENIKVQAVDYSSYKVRINEILPKPKSGDIIKL